MLFNKDVIINNNNNNKILHKGNIALGSKIKV